MDCNYIENIYTNLFFIGRYIARNDEELEQIAIKHSIGGRRGRQHASREDIIRMTKEREQEEFDTCGIGTYNFFLFFITFCYRFVNIVAIQYYFVEIPDIFIPKQCDILRTWNGESRFLPHFKFRRFGKKHLRDALQKMEKQPV